MISRLSPRRLQAGLLAGALLLVAALGAASAAYSQRHLEQQQATIVAMHRQAADAQRLLLLIAEGQALLRHWMLSGRLEDRDASVRAGEALREQGRELVGRLEVPLTARGLPPLGAALEHVLRVREQAHAAIEQEGNEAGRQLALRSGGLGTVQQIRGVLDEFRHMLEGELVARDEDLREGQAIGLLLIGVSSLAMLGMLLGALGLLARRHQAAEQARAEMDERGRQVATLFRMGELLQSSLSADDIQRVVRHTARELLPELGGAFHVFNNSRDRLDLLASWSPAAGAPPQIAEHFGPHDCWALKRGRPHACGAGGGLHCEHASGCGQGSLCIPMHARGEVYGVLQFLSSDPGALAARGELAQALADGVSLALANMALREKLRNQAMRDELTGLQNRRFLEEMLPRLVAHAERRGAAIAVLMLDLDHFKQVNDRYGHATGDAVLREVGAMLLTRLRRMDMACRYGGEELLVLMPDCSAREALSRAHELCAQVRALRNRADGALPPVTVSVGVAAWPEHGEQIGKVIEAADAALYAAKRQGRDRAVPAEATVPELTVGS